MNHYIYNQHLRMSEKKEQIQYVYACPLCSSDNLTLFYRGIDTYFSQKEVSFDTCNNCSLIFLNPRPTKEAYDEMYASVFQNKRRGLETVEASVARLESMNSYENKFSELRFFEAAMKSGANCLEIGGGWGTLSKVVSDKIGAHITIVEPSELAAKVAKEHYGMSVFNGSFDAYVDSAYEDAFDLIFAWHVFEHIADPNDFLPKAARLLHEGGKVLFAMPNILAPDQPNDRFFHIEHCYYYSPTTLRMMLEKYGFTVEHIWEGTADMKVLARYERKKPFRDIFANEEEQQLILGVLKKYNRIYVLLRWIKKHMFGLLPASFTKKVSREMVSLLRKLNIIKV